MSQVPAKTHEPSPGQTVGPFFAFGTDYEKKHEVAAPHSPGAIVLRGGIYDGEGNAVPDAMVEIWQADSDGTIPRTRGSLKRNDWDFTGFGRAFTNDDGQFFFWTRNPGSVNGKPPFIAAIVFARGLPDKLHTRIYLPESAQDDAFLASLSENERNSLTATRTQQGNLHHDFHLQGEKETVFLAYSEE